MIGPPFGSSCWVATVAIGSPAKGYSLPHTPCGVIWPAAPIVSTAAVSKADVTSRVIV